MILGSNFKLLWSNRTCLYITLSSITGKCVKLPAPSLEHKVCNVDEIQVKTETSSPSGYVSMGV